MRITEQSRSALMVLGTLARHHPDAMTAAEVAAESGITEANVFKLLKVIAKCGFVASSRGRGGGIRLAAAPEAISVGAVIRVIEPRFRGCGPAGWMLADPAGRGPLADRADALIGSGLRAFFAALDSVTVADLLEPQERAAALLPPPVQV